MVQIYKMIPDTVPCSVAMFVTFIVVVYVMRQLRGYATAFTVCRMLDFVCKIRILMNPFKYHTYTTRLVQYTRLSLSKLQCVVFALHLK